MAQHKAPTAVTIAPVQEKSGFAEFVDRYWKLGVLAALAVAGFLLYRQHAQRTAEETDAATWAKLMAVTSRDPMTGMPTAHPEDLVAVADQVVGSSAGPWALYLAATAFVGDQKFDDAKQQLARIRREYPTHSLVVDPVASEPDAPRMSLIDGLEARVDAQIAWRTQHPTLFANPAPAATATKVKVNTDRGSFVLALYTDLAPVHCENFTRLAREGTYNGMKIHRVIADSLVQAGDPNTTKEDVTAWGTGEVGAPLPAEHNTLKHFPGALAAARLPNSKQSSGSQFYVSVGENHKFDGDYVVFGTVVEGLDVVKQISESKVVAGTERPETPIVIQSVEVL